MVFLRRFRGCGTEMVNETFRIVAYRISVPVSVVMCVPRASALGNLFRAPRHLGTSVTNMGPNLKPQAIMKEFWNLSRYVCRLSKPIIGGLTVVDLAHWRSPCPQILSYALNDKTVHYLPSSDVVLADCDGFQIDV